MTFEKKLKLNLKGLSHVISAFQEQTHFESLTELYSNHILFSLVVPFILPDELCLTQKANCFKPSSQPRFNISLLSVASHTFLFLVSAPLNFPVPFYLIFTPSRLVELQHFLSSSITLTMLHSLLLSTFTTVCFLNTYRFPQLPLSSWNRHHLSLSVICLCVSSKTALK